MAFRQITATTTVQQMAPYNRRRATISIKNEGAAKVFISWDRVNVTSLGAPLAQGDGVNFVARDGDDTRMALYVQTIAGTGDLRITESFIEEAKVMAFIGEVP